jgi:ABC-2 type transport system ATP-binding protein
MPVAEFIACNSRQFVRVRTAKADELTSLSHALAHAGAQVADDDSGAVAVTGLCAAEIGDLAAAVGVTLHELSPQMASLEDAFMELTRASVEFHVHDPVTAADATPVTPPADRLAAPVER